MTTSRKGPRFSAPKTRGFTLVELLTVIAIVGVLAAIIIPVTGNVRSNARNAQCLSNVRQLAMGNLVFASENRGQLLVMLNASMNGYNGSAPFVLPEAIRNPPGVTNNSGQGNWHKTLAYYMNLDKVSARSRFICPSADMSNSSASDINNGNVSTYTVSAWLHSPSNGNGRLRAIPAPVVMVAEAPVRNSDGVFAWNINNMVSSNDERRQMFRHENRRNVALTDGSARSLTPIQDGVFRGTSGLLPNLWLPPGANTSYGMVVSTPTDTIPE